MAFGTRRTARPSTPAPRAHAADPFRPTAPGTRTAPRIPLAPALFRATIAFALACGMCLTPTGLAGIARADEGAAADQTVAAASESGSASRAAANAAGESSSPCVPTAEEIAAWDADGTLEARIAFQESLGHDQADPSLVAQAVAREDAARAERSDGGAEASTLSVPENWQGGMATMGEARVLALRVSFPAEEGEPALDFGQGDTLAALEAIIDGGGGSHPYESLSAYYERSSYGALSISGDAVDYRAEHARSYYSGNISVLFYEALAALDGSIDYTEYDANGDGAIDGVYLHFAGGDAEWGTTWWSNTWTDGSGYTFDGVAMSKLVTLHLPSNDPAAARTLIHETGHVLGLPDYYSYRAMQGQTSGRTGILTSDMMMDNVGDHNGFSKWLLGWLDDDDVTRVVANAEGVTATRSGEVVATAASGEGSAGATLELGAFTSDAVQETGGIIVVSNEDEGLFSSYYVLQYDRYAGNQSVMYSSNGATREIPSGFRLYRVQAELLEDGSDFAHTNTNGVVHDQLIELVDPDGDREHLAYDGCVSAAETDDGSWGCMLAQGDAVTPDTTPSTNFHENEALGYTGICISVGACDTHAGTVTIAHTGEAAPELPDFGIALREGEVAYNLGTIAFEATTAPQVNGSGQWDSRTYLVVDGVQHPASVSVDGTQVNVSCSFDPDSIAPDSTCEVVFSAAQFVVSETESGVVYSPEIRVSVPTGDVARIARSGTWGETASSDGSRQTSNVCALDDGRFAFFQVKDSSIALGIVSAEGGALESAPLSSSEQILVPAIATLSAYGIGDGKALLVVTDGDYGQQFYVVDVATARVEASGSLGFSARIAVATPGDGTVLVLFTVPMSSISAAALYEPRADGTLAARFGSIEGGEPTAAGDDAALVTYRYEGDAIGSTVSIVDASALASAVRERGAETLDAILDGEGALGALPAKATLELAGHTGIMDIAESEAGYAVLASSTYRGLDDFGYPAYDSESTVAVFAPVGGAPVAKTTVTSAIASSAWMGQFTEVSISDTGSVAATHRESRLASGMVPSETALVAFDDAAPSVSRVLAHATGEGAWLADGSWLIVGWHADEFPNIAGSPEIGSTVVETTRDLVYHVSEPVVSSWGEDDPDQPVGPTDPDEPTDPEAPGGSDKPSNPDKPGSTTDGGKPGSTLAATGDGAAPLLAAAVATAAFAALVAAAAAKRG